MKMLYTIAVFMIFSAHAVSGGLFDGKWSTLPSPDVGFDGFGQISGKGEYICFKAGNSVMRINVKTNELRNFKNDFGNLDFEEAVFFPLDSGHIALTSSRGISTFNGNVWAFINAPYELGGSAIDKSGTVWSICKIDSVGGTYYRVYYFQNSQWFEASFNSQITGIINLINVDAGGKIWFTGSSGVFCYNKVTDSLSFFPSDHMKYTMQDQSGNVWFFNDSSLFLTSESGLVHKYRNDYTFSPNLLQIDSNGDLWFVSKDDRKQIVKVDMNSSQTIWRFTTPKLVSALHSNPYGVFTFSNSGLFYFKNNDTTASTIFIDSLLCTSCPNVRLSGQSFSLFRKNGSHLYTTDDLLSKQLLIERVNDRCSIIPLPFECYITCMYELSDETLIAVLSGEHSGLYSYNGSTWTLYPGTEGMRISRLFEDSRGKIWGVYEEKIIRQTQTGWELIDTSNSDLPQPIRNAGFGNTFVEDSEQAVWAAFDSLVARTFDGYNWTTYTLHNFNSHVYSYQNFIYKDRNNNVQLLWCDTVESSQFAVRATFKENQWQYEKISIPGEASVYPFIYQDSRGVLYLTPFRGDTLFYYNRAVSKWVALDKFVTPYNLSHFISDDYQGKIYFKDRSGQTVVFEYNNTRVDDRTPPAFKNDVIKANFQIPGRLAIDFRLDKPDYVTIGVYSPDGKLVKMLFNGFHPDGRHRKEFGLNCARGMYIIQLKKPGRSFMSRLIVR